MKYEVLISPTAEGHLEAAYQWIARQTEHAKEWHDQFIEVLISLEENPARRPAVRRDPETGEEYRQLLFGSKHHACKILFVIRGNHVRVGQIRHGARR